MSVPFEVTILGCNSAAPAYGRHQTSQYLQIENMHMLLDCGDGTQMQIQRYGIKLNKLTHIFISHLHGDHFFGLIGLISSMNLHGRKTPLHVFGPRGLDEMLTMQFRYSETVLNFPLSFEEVHTNDAEVIFENNRISVTCIPMDHRIRCYGYFFKEKKKKRKLNRETITPDIPTVYFNHFKSGKDVYNEDGTIRYNHLDYTTAPKKSRSYAYFADTRYSEQYIEQVQGSDLLYHESTFLNEHRERAKQTYHSTATEAATFAMKANVSRLILGHYSARYKDLSPLLKEAREVFPASHLAMEGKKFEIYE